MSCKVVVAEDDTARARRPRWPSLERAKNPEESEALAALDEELAEARLAAEKWEEQFRKIQQELPEKVSENYAQGFRDGRQKAEQQMAAEHKASLDHMAAIVADMAGVRHRLRAEAEADVVRLSIAIARRVLRKQVQIDETALEGVVTAAIEKLRSADLIKVQAHPKHASAIRQQLERLGNAAAGLVEEVAALPEGALRIESTRGGIDGSIDAQLEEIEHAWAARLDH